MKRERIQPRKNWQQSVERHGLIYHTPDNRTYWDESVCYHFTSKQVDELEAATEELQRLCLEAGQFILDRDRLGQLGIPRVAHDAIRQAWNDEPPSIYGRFDLAYDGRTSPKLLEYNANTPTALLEASVIQWDWRGDVKPAADQFNSIHEKLIAKWTDLKSYLKGSPLHFIHMPDMEDLMTISYLRDTAEQAGIKTSGMHVRELGWNGHDHTFRDLDDQPVRSLFALYPWEWLLQDFAEPILSTYPQMDWIEPIWKMLWSNKGLLAILWEMFPGHPNLLESHLDGPHAMSDYARKPLLSREGANIVLHSGGRDVATAGTYGDGPVVFQAAAPVPRFDDEAGAHYAVIGSWYITDQGAAGIGVRESDSPITGNLSRFVPHYFD
jgi:glutathionylspermidine synthase